jgi:hypothetical protein
MLNSLHAINGNDHILAHGTDADGTVHARFVTGVGVQSHQLRYSVE